MDVSVFNSYQFYLAILFTYILCSFPFGLFITKIIYGIDIRQEGSGNIGMTNVMRVKGKVPGIATFIFDFFKGFISLVLVQYYYTSSEFVLIFIAFIGVFAHTRSIFLKFKGGKGVATHMGVWLFVDPIYFIIMGLVWLITYKLSKYSSLSAIISLAINPIVVWIFYGFDNYFYFSLLISLYIIFLHKKNIERLIKGEEIKMTQKK